MSRRNMPLTASTLSRVGANRWPLASAVSVGFWLMATSATASDTVETGKVPSTARICFTGKVTGTFPPSSMTAEGISSQARRVAVETLREAGKDQLSLKRHGTTTRVYGAVQQPFCDSPTDVLVTIRISARADLDRFTVELTTPALRQPLSVTREQASTYGSRFLPAAHCGPQDPLGTCNRDMNFAEAVRRDLADTTRRFISALKID